MRPRFSLNVISHASRQETLTGLTRAVSRAGGWILDHKFYSDVMIVLSLEVPGNGCALLLTCLEDAGFLPEKPETLPSGTAEDEIPATLSVTLTSGTGDVRQVIPAVDG